MIVRKRFRRLVWKVIHLIAPPEMVVALKYRQSVNSTPKSGFPIKNMVVTSRVSSGKVLVLAPHPDDEVIGPGGALCMHLENGDPVTVLYLTDGRGSQSEKPLIQIRRREAMDIGTQFGLEQIFWDIPDTTLDNSPDTVNAIIDVLAQIQPDFIYLPSFFDRQNDHFAANKLLASALRKLDNPDITILGYEIWDNIAYPNYIIDISAMFEMKATMMRIYETPMQATDFVTLFRHRNALHFLLFVNSAYREKEGYAEAFYRLNSDHFVNQFDTYCSTLITSQSPMVTGNY